MISRHEMEKMKSLVYEMQASLKLHGAVLALKWRRLQQARNVGGKPAFYHCCCCCCCCWICQLGSVVRSQIITRGHVSLLSDATPGTLHTLPHTGATATVGLATISNHEILELRRTSEKIGNFTYFSPDTIFRRMNCRHGGPMLPHGNDHKSRRRLLLGYTTFLTGRTMRLFRPSVRPCIGPSVPSSSELENKKSKKTKLVWTFHAAGLTVTGVPIFSSKGQKSSSLDVIGWKCNFIYRVLYKDCF